MGEKFLRITYEALFASESWKKLSPGEKAEALRRLFASLEDGQGLPISWKRVASLRTVGQPGAKKPKLAVPTIYEPFRSTWNMVWQEVRGFPYVWDGKQKKGLYRCHQKADGSLPAFEARVRRLLVGQKNPFLQDNASPVLLDSKWNELGISPSSGAKNCVRCGRQGTDRVELLQASVGLVCYRCMK